MYYSIKEKFLLMNENRQELGIWNECLLYPSPMALSREGSCGY
jgi:hypothetical protein